MEKLLASLWQNKGTKSYRTLLLMAVVYVGVKVSEIERRVAYLEMYFRPSLIQQAAKHK